MKRFLASTLSAAALAALAIPAVAQQTTPAPGAGPTEQRPFSRPSERIEAQLAYVHTALKITGAQEPQWKAYADKMRQIAAERDKAFQNWRARAGAQRGPGNRPTLIERMENRQKFHADAIRRLNEVLAVQKPLYAALSDEQKRVAEVVMTPRGHGGMRGGPGGRHERGFPRGQRSSA
jgi:protein CpxP